MRKGYRYLFGPVPSRRLGLSLGVDLVPHKTCTLDCVYCEVGPTTRLTDQRFDPGITSDLPGPNWADYLPRGGARLDYVTLAGSGEPTLNSDLGRIIDGIREMAPVKLAVLTNGTLLGREDVRRELARADLVIPSLDTVVERTFRRLNRPARNLDLAGIVDGLTAFRREFSGKLWLEVLLARGYNDSPEEIQALAEVIRRLNPDRVQVNTVYRPPADGKAVPPDQDVLEEAARQFGPKAEVVGRFGGGRDESARNDRGAEVLATIGRRPCTAADPGRCLGRRHGSHLALTGGDGTGRIDLRRGTPRSNFLSPRSRAKPGHEGRKVIGRPSNRHE